MKLLKYIIGIVIVLAIAVFYFLDTNQGTLTEDEKRFGLDNLQNVSVITISRGEDSLLFEKRKGVFYHKKSGLEMNVNHLGDLNQMLGGLVVQYPLTGDFAQKVSNQFKEHAIDYTFLNNTGEKLYEVKFFSNKALGGEFLQHSHSSHIFKVYPKSFIAFKEFEQLKLSAWREKTLFAIAADEIVSVKVTKDDSYKITKDIDGFFIETGSSKQKRELEKVSGTLFFSEFKKVNLHTVLNQPLKKYQLFGQIEVVLSDGESRYVGVYVMFNEGGARDLQYALVKINNSIWGLIEWTKLDPIMPSAEFWQ